MPDVLTSLVIRYWKLSIGLWLVLNNRFDIIVTGGVNALRLFPNVVPAWHQIAADGESVRLPRHENASWRAAIQSAFLMSNSVAVPLSLSLEKGRHLLR